MSMAPGTQAVPAEVPALLGIERHFECCAFVSSEQRGGELRVCHRPILRVRAFADCPLDVNLRRIEKRHTMSASREVAAVLFREMRD